MNKFLALLNGYKALRQLGPTRLAENVAYRGGLWLNLWRVPEPVDQAGLVLNMGALPELPDQPPDPGMAELLQEAHEIVSGQVRLFGGHLQSLNLAPPDDGHGLRPWSDYERGRADQSAADVKFGWEPARFGWAVCLARAFRVSGEAALAECFLENLKIFWQANPPYLGMNWVSGQEVALRIITWAFAARAFWNAPASTPERKALLAEMIAAHAGRIPPTLIYARSQDNNHLLSEAAGLLTAGWLLPGHPAAAEWRRLGWLWFNQGVQRQVAADGGYVQQSCNYHRLMLHLALWVDALARQNGLPWPPLSCVRLEAAAQWLQIRLDPVSGSVPNLGHNDGACLFPFGAFGDYRPTVQAAGLAFAELPVLTTGPWDELAAWMGLPGVAALEGPEPAPVEVDADGVILRGTESWAMLRAAHYRHRPGQSDQLHVDLWWRGQNITMDAGTYRYNAPPPWDNGLSGGEVHNSITVDGKEAMTRAGRFLWLDWDQAAVIRLGPQEAVAERGGYDRLGVRHRRSVEWVQPNLWRVEDELLPVGKPGLHHFWLHWLLPDWPWQVAGTALRLAGPLGVVRISISGAAAEEIQLIRGGERLVGSGNVPAVLGWFSPTYAHRLPALSWRVGIRTEPPVRLTTVFELG